MSAHVIHSLFCAFDFPHFFELVRRNPTRTYHASTLNNAFLSDNMKMEVGEKGRWHGYPICIPNGDIVNHIYLPTPLGAIRLKQRGDGSIEAAIYDTAFLKWCARCTGERVFSRFGIENLYTLRHIYLRSFLKPYSSLSGIEGEGCFLVDTLVKEVKYRFHTHGDLMVASLNIDLDFDCSSDESLTEYFQYEKVVAI